MNTNLFSGEGVTRLISGLGSSFLVGGCAAGSALLFANFFSSEVSAIIGLMGSFWLARSAPMLLRFLSLILAVTHSVDNDRLKTIGVGGLIMVSDYGLLSLPFTLSAFYRAVSGHAKEQVVTSSKGLNT